MERYDRRILFLAAESTAGLGLNYDRLFIGQVQGTFQGTVDVVRALERADDLDGSIRVRNSDGSLWLDIQLLLKTDPENPLHHLQILQILQIVQNLAFPGACDGDVVGVAGAPRNLVGTLATGDRAADDRLRRSRRHVR